MVSKDGAGEALSTTRLASVSWGCLCMIIQCQRRHSAVVMDCTHPDSPEASPKTLPLKWPRAASPGLNRYRTPRPLHANPLERHLAHSGCARSQLIRRLEHSKHPVAASVPSPRHGIHRDSGWKSTNLSVWVGRPEGRQSVAAWLIGSKDRAGDVELKACDDERVKGEGRVSGSRDDRLES